MKLKEKKSESTESMQNGPELIALPNVKISFKRNIEFKYAKLCVEEESSYFKVQLRYDKV